MHLYINSKYEREESEKEEENLREGMGRTDGDSQQHSSPKESQNRPTSERSPEGEDHYVVATLVRLARPSNHQLFL